MHTHRKAQQDDGFVRDLQETSSSLDAYFFHFAQLPKVSTKYQLTMSHMYRMCSLVSSQTQTQTLTSYAAPEG